MAWACATRSTTGWSGGSTTTHEPPSSSTLPAVAASSRRSAGGGRYDGLAELLGGSSTPGIGFGIGIDRTVLAAAEQDVATPQAAPLLVVVGADPDALAPRLAAAGTLRSSGLRVRVDGSSRKLGRQLESAAKLGARYAILIDPLLADGQVILRDLEASEQREVPLSEVAAAIG